MLKCFKCKSYIESKNDALIVGFPVWKHWSLSPVVMHLNCYQAAFEDPNIYGALTKLQNRAYLLRTDFLSSHGFPVTSSGLKRDVTIGFVSMLVLVPVLVYASLLFASARAVSVMLVICLLAAVAIQLYRLRKCEQLEMTFAKLPISAHRAKLILPGNREITLKTPVSNIGRNELAATGTSHNLDFVSRKHFTITFENGKYYIEDQDSKNGTRLNGLEIRGRGRYELNDGDIIDVAGVATLVFRNPDQARMHYHARLVFPNNKKVELPTGVSIIGREDFSGILAPERLAYISRTHVMIMYQDGAYWVEDTASANGTKLNDVQIRNAGPKRLHSGDRITLADQVTVIFECQF